MFSSFWFNSLLSFTSLESSELLIFDTREVHLACESEISDSNKVIVSSSVPLVPSLNNLDVGVEGVKFILPKLLCLLNFLGVSTLSTLPLPENQIW
jgi:hypothetical protein